MSAGRTKLDSLSAVAELLRDSLKRSQVVDDNMLGIIESCNRRLSSLELEVALLPIQVRHTHAFRIAHQNIEKTLAAAESILSQFDVARKVESKIDRGPHEDLVSYLEAVDELLANVEYFSYNRSNDGVLNHARSVLSVAMDKLSEEFRSLLVQHSKSEDPAKLSKYLPQPQASRNANRSFTELTSPGSPGARLADLPLVLIPPDIIPNLQEMAHRLIAATHSQQCLAIYTEIRASALEQTLCKLGFEELTKDEVETLQWEILKEKIGSWNRCMCIVVKLLYSAERDLCKEVFRGLDPYESRCFLKVTINSFKSLLSTGNAITQNKRSPNKLFALLDMYDTMHDLLPEIEANFYGNESYEVFQAAIDFIQMLAQTTRETFDDFLERVEKDASKTLLQDGSVHPFTNYVIKYVKFLLDYQTTLKQLFEDDDQGDKSSSYLAKSTAKIMQLLLSNLDGKAKQYTDPALGHIFLMNNIHYIVQFVRGSEAKDLLSDNWIDRHRLLVQQHAQGYKQSTWGKVLPCLSGSSGISSSVIKERFKIFNTLFEEVHRKQSQWTIPEAELREAVQLAVAEVLLPAYRRRYNAILENSKNPQKYVKYKPEDIKQLIGEFFEPKNKSSRR